MEVVIRTAHGSADVDLASYDDRSTLRDVVDAVTGLSVPQVVAVDGRPCRIDERIVDAIVRLGLRVGSTIDVTSERDGEPARRGDVDSPPLVRLRQLTGRGAGEVVDLPAGRYRFGAGRRLVDRELSSTIVEEEAFIVSVATRSAIEAAIHPSVVARGAPDVLEVLVRPGANVSGELGPFTPMLGNQLFDRELPWHGERLSVGGRVFDLVELGADRHDDPTPIGAARIGPPDRDGVRSFDAAGTIAVPDDDPSLAIPVLGALKRIDDPTRTLWRRRPDRPSLRAPVGLTADHRSTVWLDLERHRGAALAGSDDFTAGMARTVLLELVAAAGPGDLDIVVVASAGRLGRWDWTKWLPHTRGGDPTRPPQFVTTDDELSEWLDGSGFAPDGPSADDDRSADEGPTPNPGPDPDEPAAAPAVRADGLASTNLLDPPPSMLPPPVGRPHARPTPDLSERQTLLIVDDATSWTGRGTPLRALLLDPPPGLHVLAVVDSIERAPGSCTTSIEEIRPDELLGAPHPSGGGGSDAATRLFGSLCRHIERHGNAPVVTTDVRPAMVQSSTATRAARALASFDDLRVRRTVESAPRSPTLDRPTLGDVLGVLDVASPLPPPGSTTIPIGRRHDPRTDRDPADGDEPAPLSWVDAATIDLAVAGVTGIAADAPDDAQLLAAITLGAAARRRPGDLAILLVADEEPRWLSPLPHLLGTVDGNDTEQVGRVIRRIAAAIAAEPDFELLVVIAGGVADDAGPRRLTDASLAFVELAGSLDRIHLVVSAGREHADMLRRHLGARCGAFVRSHGDGTATLAHRSATLDVGTARVMPTTELVLPTVRPAPPPAPSPGLRVLPFVHGRPLTPIERRLSRRNDTLRDAARRATGTPIDDPRSDASDPSADAAAGRRSARRTLLPPPFPERVAQETLLPDELDRGRGVLALGIVDRTDGDGFDVFRWAPGSGSLLAVGNRRAGTGVLTDVAAVALADLDIDVWALDPLPQRRRAFRRLPHCRTTADPDSARTVLRFLADLERRVEHLRDGHLDDPDTTTSDALAAAVRGGPRPIVVVIADVPRTLAHFDDDEAAAVMERFSALVTPIDPTVPAAIRPAPVAIVAAASRRSEIESLLDSAVDVLVGTVDDRERRGFGVPERAVVSADDGDGIAGRCWSTTRQRLVQLATPPDSIEQFIRERVVNVAERSVLPPPPPDAVAASEPIGVSS